MISPTSSLIYFSLLTIIYFVLKYYLVDKYGINNKGLGVAMGIIYLAIMTAMQLSANLKNAKEKCGGTPQTVSAITYTLIPNFLIFGGLLMCLMFFPGWKAPFSNTIGYLIVASPLLKIKDVFNNILVTSSNNKLLKMVYRDPSLMINEMTPENFKLFINKMDSSKHSILSRNYKEYIPDLYNLVVIKDRVADFVWYILTGALVISNSYSYIMSIRCKRTATELQNKLDTILSNPTKEAPKQKWILSY